MTERQINKWLRRQFSGICWLLLGYYVLMNILVLATAVVDVIRQFLWDFAVSFSFSEIDTNALIQNAGGYLAAVAVGLVLLYAWKGSNYWKEEIFAREKPMEGLTFFWMVTLCMGAQELNAFWISLIEVVMNSFGRSILPSLEYVSGGSTTFSMFFYTAIAAPISEEILFRGVVLRSLRPYGKRFSILFSALLFGLFHGNLLQGPYAVLVGLLLGYLACEYSILWAIALHLFNNLILSEGLAWLQNHLPEAVGNGFQVILMFFFFLLSIVLLVRKHREIRAYRQREWLDRRCVKCFLTNIGFWVFTTLMVINMAAFVG